MDEIAFWLNAFKYTSNYLTIQRENQPPVSQLNLNSDDALMSAHIFRAFN